MVASFRLFSLGAAQAPATGAGVLPCIFSGGRWSFSSAGIGLIPKNSLDLVL